MNIAVIIPCYKSKDTIISVLDKIGDEVTMIIVVDDACPDASGQLVRDECQDPRVVVVEHKVNLGVGGAMKTGYIAALTNEDIDIFIKIDSDGQMDATQIKSLINMIVLGKADYTKGNRFFDINAVKSMPVSRIIGNAGLSFLTKISSGYWSLFDPTNGYTAIHRIALNMLDLEKIDNRFFFESDMLFKLNIIGAVVQDVPMPAIYGAENSNLSALNSLFVFSAKHIRNTLKRIFYNYFLRGFSLASIQLLLGIILLAVGGVTGAIIWSNSLSSGEATTPGTAILIGVCIMTGMQLLLSFISFDFQHEPKVSLQSKLLTAHATS